MIDDAVKGLGPVQRMVAKLLQPVFSINPVACGQKLGVSTSMDVGYYGAVLIRLAERGIAAQVGETWNYVRGPRWGDAANLYGWADSPELKRGDYEHSGHTNGAGNDG